MGMESVEWIQYIIVIVRYSSVLFLYSMVVL
jgi:hypothetical protein